MENKVNLSDSERGMDVVRANGKATVTQKTTQYNQQPSASCHSNLPELVS